MTHRRNLGRRWSWIGLGVLLGFPGVGAAGQGLPLPTGAYPAGTVRWSAPLTGAHPAGLPVAAQIFYPAEATVQAAPSGYLTDHGLLRAMIEQGYYGQSREVLRGWERLTLAAVVGAPPARTRRPRPFPLVVFFPGLGVSRTQYAGLAQDLSSHGFVVVTVDYARGGFVVDPRGAFVSEPVGDLQAPGAIDTLANAWADAADHLLDRWRDLPVTSSVGRVMAAVDTTAVGAIGHSLGGTAAWASCRRHPRFRACAGLDGTLTDGLVAEGMTGATLVMQSEPVYSDADLAAAGRTRARWTEMGEAVNGRWEMAISSAGAAVWRVGVRGFGHLSFSDAPLVMPGTITRFGGQIVGPLRSHEIVTTYVRAFFDRTLRDYPAAVLDADPSPFPEVVRR